RVSFISISIASVILYMFSDMIIISLYGDKFHASIPVLNFLLPGVVLLTIFKVMNMDLAGKGKPLIALKAMIPALIINIIAILFLVPKYGAKGTAISSTISYSLASILFLYYYSKAIEIPIIEI